MSAEQATVIRSGVAADGRQICREATATSLASRARTTSMDPTAMSWRWPAPPVRSSACAQPCPAQPGRLRYARTAGRQPMRPG